MTDVFFAQPFALFLSSEYILEYCAVLIACGVTGFVPVMVRFAFRKLEKGGR